MIRNMVKFFSGIIMMLAAVSACAIPVTGPGFTPLGEIDTYGVVNDNPNDYTPTQNYIGGFFFVISGTPRPPYYAACNQENPYNISLISGTSYYGARVAPGIYLVFYDSVITSVNYYRLTGTGQPSETRVIRFDSNGRMQNGSKTCIGNTVITTTQVKYTHGQHDVSGILKYGMYVTPEATSGSEFNLSFYVYRTHSSTIAINEPTQVNLVDCSVATPASIDFGDIPAGNTRPVIDNSA
ncbi:hypothetical protein, partial [uncultured Cedecea sp.]|uniref:hypothetical protein n=1 Tax=uncultured Cedecea sp. TaxID=988762 RepID=UPI002629A5FB